MSLNVGITHDEPHSNWVWELNKKKISNIFFNSGFNIDDLDSYHGYYGIGPYLFSIPFDLIFSKFINKSFINSEGEILLLKHPIVFIFFFISAIYFKKLIFLATKDKSYSYLATAFFLTYPYLLGHSFFNIKDIPFMSIWLICTFYLIKNLNYFFYRLKFKYKDLIIFSFLTSYLISIRINGILIFLEYIIFLCFYLSIYKFNLFNFLIKTKKEIFLFLSIFLISSFLFYPSFWNEPIKFLESIFFFGKITQTVCTLTLGTCMKTQDLPPSYLLIWLSFKLPIIILLGLILFPILEKKLFKFDYNKLIIGSFLSTILLIIFLFIVLGVYLYDEVRQILFLIPLILLVSLTLIYNFRKKLSFILVSFYIIFFLVQNISLFPYNYLWLNNFNVLLKVQKNFELDYWGVSTKKIAEYFNSNNPKEDNCIISNRNNGIKYYLINQKRCFKSFNNLHKKNARPFYVVLTERSLNKGIPNNCKIIHEENLKINISKENLYLARIFKCV